ncbi:hypothetical protein BDL97_19G059600 [Sphagnum fallax]|nr:hypothetical protein BDL97_19G059600 [Sphagnum fallax]
MQQMAKFLNPQWMMENMLRILEKEDELQDPEIWIRAEAAIQHEYNQVLKMRLESNNFASHCQAVHQLFSLQVEAPIVTVLEDFGASASTHSTPDANWRSENKALSPPSNNGMEQWLTDGDQEPLPSMEQDTVAPFDQKNPFPPFEMVEGDEVCY